MSYDVQTLDWHLAMLAEIAAEPLSDAARDALASYGAAHDLAETIRAYRFARDDLAATVNAE